MNSKLIVVVIFHFSGIIYAAETENTKTLYEEFITDEQAAEALSSIQPEEALPLVLFKHTATTVSILPSELHEIVASEDGKIIGLNGLNGTKFTSIEEAEQMFFCPNETLNNKCLIRQNFESDQYLRCASQPITFIKPDYNFGCSDDGKAYFLTPYFKYCDAEKQLFNTKGICFYTTCYDVERKKTLFTSHIIKSTKLLNSKLLLREREVNYNMEDGLNKATQIEEEFDSQQQTKKPSYRLQKLVPSEDMAFGVWRKTTFERLNVAWQHEGLFDLWNEMCEYVRHNAIRMHADENVETLIYTRVFDIDSVLGTGDYADNQISNIWIKLIFIQKPNIPISDPTHGIAILMNNFIDTEMHISTSSKSREKVIEDYCDEDLCIDSFKNKFKQIKARIRCCLVTRKILDLFTYNDDAEIEILHIPHITEDHEILKEGSITVQQSVTLIDEIKPEEALPLVLLLATYDRELRIPTHIVQIETKNKRISYGSQFTNKYLGQQMFFCPRNNPQEKCLEPQTFNSELNILQCKQEAIPSIKESQITNMCAYNRSSKLYRFVYEICTIESNESKTTEIQMYEFCYDTNREKILFTYHKIMSPQLLVSNLLVQERAIEYPMIMEDKLPLSNLKELKKAQTLVISKENKELTLPGNRNKPAYVLQKLTPSEDMAFALWRKPTYNYVNVGLQHEKLAPLWSEINRYIKNDAIYENYSISIHTGVFDNESRAKYNADGQKSNIWVKLISNEESEPRLGLAILMKNFLTTETNQSKSTKTDNLLDKYCEKNFCVQSFQEKFEKIQGQVRCCRLTMEIGKLFGMPNINVNAKLLTIRGITV